jgi:hypothetical protein
VGGLSRSNECWFGHGDPGGQTITGNAKAQSECSWSSAADSSTHPGPAEILSDSDGTPVGLFPPGQRFSIQTSRDDIARTKISPIGVPHDEDVDHQPDIG